MFSPLLRGVVFRSKGGSMKLVVFGASGATGRHVVRIAGAAGWSVVAFARTQAAAMDFAGEHEPMVGNPTELADVTKAVRGADAVAVCLGISRLTRSPFAALVSPPDLTSRSVAAIVQAMQNEHVRRIVYVSAFGAADSWARMPWWGRLFIQISKVRHSMADHTRSEQLLRASGLDWTALRPVLLDDAPSALSAAPMGLDGPRLAKVSREALARTVVHVLRDGATFGQAIGLEG